MEGHALLPGTRLGDIAAAHPEVDVYRIARHVLGAWIPDEPGSLTGSLTCACTEDDLADGLLAKLTAALG
jgi:hypothetical protein